MLRKDYKLFISLVLWSIIPSIYLIIRMNIVAINSVDINIFGQIEWFDLIDETITTTLTVPLYFLLKPNKSTKEQNGYAFLLSFIVYTIFTLIVSSKIASISEFMNATNATQYLYLQSFSMLASFVGTFMILLFTLNNDYKTIRIMLLFKMCLLCFADYFLISNFLEIGAPYSNIIVNCIISILTLIIAYIRKYIVFGKCNKEWLSEWVKIGSQVGLQIFLDNYIYAVMICRMVNAVEESGNYWIANNFIWRWLLVPVSCLAEIIKKNNLDNLTFNNTWVFVLIIVGLWLITMPGWNWFVTNAMASNPSTILRIVYPSAIFYLSYIISSCIDAWFVSKGKSKYVTIISIVVNIVYYGIVYILFKQGIFTKNMNFIIMMFGFGMIVHMLMSVSFYIFEINNKNKIQI